MSLLTIFKSAFRFLLATVCVMLVTLAVRPETSMGQGSSQLGCHEIAILGAVKAPGRFEIPARMRLVEALTKVGGPSERAGKVVQVIHFCQCSPCPEGGARAATSTEYNLSAALAGREDANPFVGPGEIIIVPEAELVWVVGNVVSQKSLIYREGVKLKQAIAMVGGVAKNSDLVRIRIYRNPSTGPRPNPLIFILKAVLDNRSEDPVLQSRDIIEISDETGSFQSPLRPLFFLDPPLIRPPGEAPLIQRRSSNC